MRWSFYDEIEEIQYGKEITAHKTFSSRDEFFHDHFPGYPVVPGSVQIEAMAQVAGRLIAISQHHLMNKKDAPVIPFMTMVESAVFRRIVTAEQKIILKAEIVSMSDDYAILNCRIYVNGETAARAKLFFKIEQCTEPSEMNSLYGVSEKADMVTINDSIWDYLEKGNRGFIDEILNRIL